MMEGSGGFDGAGFVSAAIVKHTNPCGAALAGSCREAVDLAIAGDPVAAYGGILAVGDEFDDEAAERLQSKDIFLEVIIAPRLSRPGGWIRCGRAAGQRAAAGGGGLGRGAGGSRCSA